MSESSASHRRIPPWYWGLLYLPFGISSGFVSVTLVYILSNGKVKLDDETLLGLVALNTLPHTWKFFWSPVADVTLTRKRWYMIANLLGAACVTVIAFTPIKADSIGTLRTMIFLSSLAMTVLGMAVEGLMAHATEPEHRGSAAGWFQAGNLGGGGIGGGIALIIAEHVSTEAAFLTTAGLMFACSAMLHFVPEAPHNHPPGGFINRFGKAIVDVAKDLWQMVASRRGVVAVFLVFLPIGSAAGSGLFSAMAKTWGAGAEQVALTSGLLAGGVSVVGCLVGGWLSDKMGRRSSYVFAGVLLAIVAVAMALAPRNPVTYTTFVLLYQFGGGVAYGTFTGFVLSVIGKGAVATKYNALASLSNIPIWYMALVNGWAATKFSQVEMLYVDAASEIIGIVAFGLILIAVRPGRDVEAD